MISVDTHALVWWLTGQSPLPPGVSRLLDEQKKGEGVAVSAMVFWELALLFKKKRLYLTLPFEEWIAKIASLPFLTILPVTHSILIQSVFLPDSFPKDPADRIIAATAIENKFVLITKDGKIRKNKQVETFWE